MANLVGIDDHGPLLGKHPRYGALSGKETTGKTNNHFFDLQDMFLSNEAMFEMR
jgi:hypothetical protein